ncbi:MAG: hypothetical protein WCJ46_05470 [bacterium]
MKRIFVICLALVALVWGGIFFYSKVTVRRISPIHSGTKTVDFILGTNNFNTYSLASLTEKYSIVLSFLDASSKSARVKKITTKTVPAFFKGKAVLWFTITHEGAYAIIEEQTGNLPLLYKTFYSNIPAFYSFQNYPAFTVSDRNGIITLLYIGYSPTFMLDIKRELKRLF